MEHEGQEFMTLEAIELEPAIRVSVELTHTLKDGWRVAATKASAEGVKATAEAVDAIGPILRRALTEAFAQGQAEADARNADDTVEPLPRPEAH